MIEVRLQSLTLQSLKKAVYLAGFIILGALTSFLAHAGIEIWYIGRLVADFDRYSFGFSWSQWVIIHHIGAIILFLLGIIAGFLQGRFWWRIIYIDKKLQRFLPFFTFKETF